MAVTTDGGATSDTPDWDSLQPATAAPEANAESSAPDWDSLQAASEPPKESSGIFRRAIADPLVTAAKSVVGTGQAAVGLADIPTLGKAGKALESVGVDFPRTQQILEEAYSPEQQEANRRVRDAQGFTDTLGQYAENPSVIAHDIGQSVGPMLLGQGIGGAAMKAAPAISRGVAGAVGEGSVTAGSNAEQIREETPGGELTPGQTALAAGSGALTGAITGGSNVLAKKLGVGDINTLLIPGADDVAKQGALNKAKAVGTEAALEAGQETVQSGQETAATNLATGKDVTEGLGNAMASGAVTGGGMGLGGGILSQAGSAPITPPPAPEVVPAAEEQPKTNFEAVTENLKAQVGPVKGIATKAATMAVDAGITPEQQAAQVADTQPMNPIDGLPETPSGEVGGPPENTELNQEPTEQSVTPTLDPAAASMARNALNTVQASLDKGGVMGTVPPVLRNAAKAVGAYDASMTPEQLLETVAQRLAANDAAPAEQPIENDFDFDESIPFDFAERTPRPTAADRDTARDAAAHDAYHAEDEQDEDAYLEREREIRRQEAAAQPPIEQPSTPQQEPENGESENATEETTSAEETVDGKEKYIPTNSIVEAAAVTEAAKRGLADEQIKAGEYQRGFTKFDGLDIAIENGAGTTRSGVSEDGKRWSQQMKSHYGEIGVRDENGNLKTGADGDLVDVFVNPDAQDSDKVFIVDQINPKTGAFDEHKVLAGYPTIAAARKAYLENYEPGWKGLGAITPMKMADFKAWLQTEDATKPVSDKLGAPAAAKRTKAPDMQTQIRDAAAKEQDAKIHNELMAGFKEERDFENRAKQRVAFLDKYRNYAAFTQSLINNDFEKAVDDLYRNRVPQDTAAQIFEDAKATGLLTELTQRKVEQELSENKKPSSEVVTNVEEGRVADNTTAPEKQDQSIDPNLEAAKTLLLRAVPDGDLMKLYGDRNIDLRVALFRALSGDQKIPKTKAKSITDLVNLFYDKAGIPMDTLAGRNAKFKAWTQESVGGNTTEPSAVQDQVPAAKEGGNAGPQKQIAKLEKLLTGKSKIPGHEHQSKAEALKSMVDQERGFKIVEDYDSKAREKDQKLRDKISNAVITLNSNQYLPFRLQQEYEELAKYVENDKVQEIDERLRADNYRKQEYRVYQGIKTSGGFNTITKPEYEYAQLLLKKEAENVKQTEDNGKGPQFSRPDFDKVPTSVDDIPEYRKAAFERFMAKESDDFTVLDGTTEKRTYAAALDQVRAKIKEYTAFIDCVRG